MNTSQFEMYACTSKLGLPYQGGGVSQYEYQCNLVLIVSKVLITF